MKPICDRERKRDLLNEWMKTHAFCRQVFLLTEGEPFSDPTALKKIRDHVNSMVIAEEVIYILIASITDCEVPVYVGRARDVCRRWNAHLSGMRNGTGVYARWRSMLLTDAMTARYPLFLMVVPGSQILVPPIPEFPATIGAVEYQLVSLIADAYPSMLLNHEGRLR